MAGNIITRIPGGGASLQAYIYRGQRASHGGNITTGIFGVPNSGAAEEAGEEIHGPDGGAGDVRHTMCVNND